MRTFGRMYSVISRALVDMPVDRPGVLFFHATASKTAFLGTLRQTFLLRYHILLRAAQHNFIRRLVSCANMCRIAH